MEKYSRWRDPGTGIQPFLTPVPPRAEGSVLHSGLTGLRYAVAAVRLVPVLVCVGLYALTVELVGGSLIALGLTAVGRPVQHVFTRLWTRVVLLLLGALWLDERRSSSSSRGKSDFHKTWTPKAGDVVVSNWASWVELLYFAARLDPVFVVPTSARTVVGHASPVLPLTLRAALGFVGHTPNDLSTALAEPFDVVRRRAQADGRPLVLFPEGTTTNGRGLLRFIDVFGPAGADTARGDKPWTAWVACVKYATPTPTAPTATYSVPARRLPVVRHVLALLSAFPPAVGSGPLTVHLLSALDAPNAQMSGLTEACAKAVGALGRMKRIGFDFDDKKAFFDVLWDTPASTAKAKAKASSASSSAAKKSK